MSVTFFLLAEQCVKACSYHGNELSKDDGSELWFWHVLMTRLTLFKLASTKVCCLHQDQADCNFSSSYPNRRLQCSYLKAQKQRKWAATDAHRIKSARPRQVSFHKGQKHLSKLSSTWQSEWNPKDLVRIQHAAALSCGLHSRLLASPLSIVGLVPVFSQQPWEAANTLAFSHTMRNPGYFQSSWTGCFLATCHCKTWTSFASAILRRSLCTSTSRSTQIKCLVSWGIFTSSRSGPEADSQYTTDWYMGEVNAV